MTIRNLAEVRARLEEAVAGLPGEPADTQEEYSRFEETAAAILDSEFEDFGPGTLEKYLTVLCTAKLLELDLAPDYHE